MWNRNLGIDLIVQTIVTEFEQESLLNSGEGFEKSIRELKKRFPECSEAKIIEILQLACSMYAYKTGEQSELVITAPNSFKLKTRKTKTVVAELIANAESSITLTGYSVSEYFSEMIDEIVRKSTQGLYVNLYINDVEKQQKHIDKLLIYAGKFIKIYNYNKENHDKMSALHAKIIVVDGRKSFVSSANLSYHGMQGNIEMGILIESEKRAKEIEEVLKVLKSQKVFLKYK